MSPCPTKRRGTIGTLAATSKSGAGETNRIQKRNNCARIIHALGQGAIEPSDGLGEG
jgi:hypothetical protein